MLERISKGQCPRLVLKSNRPRRPRGACLGMTRASWGLCRGPLVCPPLIPPPPIPLGPVRHAPHIRCGGGGHPPNSAVLGRTECEASPAEAWEGRRGAGAALVSSGTTVALSANRNTFPPCLWDEQWTQSIPQTPAQCAYTRRPQPAHLRSLRGKPPVSEAWFGLGCRGPRWRGLCREWDHPPPPSLPVRSC